MESSQALKRLFIVPAYNEEENIDKVIGDLLTVAKGDEILIVNDGSQDKTLEAIKAHPVHFIDLPVNLGVAAALRAGFRFALRNGITLAVQFDGDGQHIAQETEKIISPVVNQDCDCAVGARKREEDASSTFTRRLGSTLLSKLLSLITGNLYCDPTSGFRAYSAAAIERFAEDFPDEYPEVESIVLAKKFDLKVKEYPVAMRPRLAGKSTIGKLGAAYYMVKVLVASVVMMLRKY